MIDSRVQANLVHDCDSSLLCFLLQFEHRGGDIAGCDNILLVPNGRFDDDRMEGIGDQANDQVVLCDFRIESFIVRNIERNGFSILDSRRESFGTFEASACCTLVNLRPNHYQDVGPYQQKLQCQRR